MELTDTQLVLLGAASRREDGAIELAPSLKGGGAHKRRVAAARRNKTRNEAPQRSATRGRRNSKQSRVLAMLQARQGATIATIMKATGWQPHSVRGFLAGVVRKRLSLTLVSEKTGEGRVYRIVAKDGPPKRKGKSGRKSG